jgi:hypothetical protein
MDPLNPNVQRRARPGGPRRKRRGWLAYAVALTFAVLAGEAANLTRIGLPNAVTFANWALTAALLTALWAYAMNRPLGSERYWRTVFWLVLVANVLILMPVLMLGGAIAAFTAALTLAVVPAYVAAWRYAYRCPELWRPPDTAAG